MKEPVFRSLRLKISIAILILGLASLTALNLFTRHQIYVHDLEALDKQLTYLKTSQLESITASAWTLNTELSQIQITSIAQLPSIAYAAIHFADKTIISTGNPERQSGFIERRFPLNHNNSGEMVYLGELVILANPQKFHSYSYPQVFSILFAQCLGMLALIYLCSQLINKLIFRHLSDMSKYMRSRVWENISEEFKLNRKKYDPSRIDELDLLANALNTLTKKIKEYEKEITHSEERLSKVFNASTDAIIVSRKSDGLILDANKSFERTFGFHKKEVLGRFSTDLSIWESKKEREELLKSLDNMGSLHSVPYRYRQKDGKPRDCLVSSETITLNNETCIVSTFRDITEQKENELALYRSRENLRSLVGRLEEIREEERIGIARELHDQLGQMLTSLKIDLHHFFSETTTTANAVENLTLLSNNIDLAIDTVRKISSDLRPAALDDLGLIAALEWYTQNFSERTKIPCTLSVECDDLKPNALRDTAIFRIYQEILTNISRHSHADQFWTRLFIENGNLHLTVEDNGVGSDNIDLEDVKSIGLLGMKERTILVNGKLHIGQRSSGRGTAVSLIVPLSKS